MRNITGGWRSGHLSTSPPRDSQSRVIARALEQEAAASDPASDEQAAAEAAQFASGKTEAALAKEAREREHGRDQRFKDHFERIAIWGMYSVAVGIFIASGIWLFHTLAPARWCWLSAEEIQSLQNGIGGIIVISVLADHFKKRLG